MVHLYTDLRMLAHRPWSWHPECPDRLSAILDHLEHNGQRRRCVMGEFGPAADELLSRVHDPAYLAEVVEFERGGGGQFDPDTYVSSGSVSAARLAAGAVVAAVRQVVESDDRLALCLVRPPGHHARPSTAMGFCLYSNIAVGASFARADLGLDRVLIVDFDVHHGNGTQEAFYEDPTVSFLSVHRHPFYPGTGTQDETGSGPGLGFNRNVPLRFGTKRAEFHAAFRAALHDLADKARPDLVLLSAGFDAHLEDPVGSLGLEVEDFETLTSEVLKVASTHASGRLVSVLEGGYNLDVLPLCVEAHLKALGVSCASETGA